MAFSEFELKRYETLMDEFIEIRRPPVQVRDQVDLAYEIDNQTVVVFETRIGYSDPKQKIKCEIAKATFVKTTSSWKIYWMKSDLKWHSYSPRPEVSTLEEFIKELDADEYSCFWG